MKSPLFFVASALLVVAPLARAQDAAPSVDSAPAGIVAPNAPENGWKSLVAAGKLILPGENGSPSTAEKNLSPAENLRRQRVAIARNAPALKLLREALQMPVSVPAITSNEDVTASFAPNAAAREMARLLRQESDVRLADGDAAGALDSRLTTLELGAAITRGGPLINSLVGAAIEAIGRNQIETVAAKLDASQIRAALPRMKAVDARRATYLETLQQEKAVAIRLFLLQSKEFADDKETEEAKKALATPEGRKEAGISEKEARELLALTPEILVAQFSADFDAILARDALPYERARQVKLPPVPNASVEAITGLYRQSPSRMRFSYERNRAAQSLLEAALELRAIKLETGAYPITFETPLDPFGNNEPLIYERRGDSYLLYSIGPDGQDNGGRAFKSSRQAFDPESGTTQIFKMRGVQVDSKGDILSPIF